MAVALALGAPTRDPEAGLMGPSVYGKETTNRWASGSWNNAAPVLEPGGWPYGGWCNDADALMSSYGPNAPCALFDTPSHNWGRLDANIFDGDIINAHVSGNNTVDHETVPQLVTNHYVGNMNWITANLISSTQPPSLSSGGVSALMYVCGSGGSPDCNYGYGGHYDLAYNVATFINIYPFVPTKTDAIFHLIWHFLGQGDSDYKVQMSFGTQTSQGKTTGHEAAKSFTYGFSESVEQSFEYPLGEGVSGSTKVGFTASQSTATSTSDTFTSNYQATESGSITKSCDAPDCSQGFLWQYQVVYSSPQHPNIGKVMKDCNFACTPTYDMQPRCPPSACCLNGWACRVCTHDWTAKQQLPKKVIAGSRCLRPDEGGIEDPDGFLN